MSKSLVEKGGKMKGLLLGMMLSAMLFAPGVSSTSMQVQYAQASAEENVMANMAKTQLILKKLRGSMAIISDLDDLERAGMDKRDVNRMRRAMNQKIKQLMDEAIEAL